MEDKRAELLDYIRVLYERQNDKASKAGMTYWAILAGMIYVLWHMFEAISQFPDPTNTRGYFYYVFSQIHIALIAVALLISRGGLPAQKRAFDYRVTSDDPLNPQAIFSDIIIIGLPLYCTYKAQLLETLSQFQEFQLGINYWFLMVAILFLLFGVACERFRKRKAKLPSPAGLVVTSSPYLKVFIIGLYLLFIEIFIGNSIAIASDIYSQNNSGKIFAAALDLSLISFGLFLLARRSQTNEYLSRLSKLERDVIIHELSKEDISQRLQDEFLGNYVGDWIERFLQEVRDKSEAVSKLSKKAENVIAEIQEIDEKYEHERSGRAKKYTEELKSLLQSFNASIAPLIDWLSEAELQSAINKDKFIQSIVASTIKELKANDRDVRERANLAINKFEQWLNK